MGAEEVLNAYPTSPRQLEKLRRRRRYGPLLVLLDRRVCNAYLLSQGVQGEACSEARLPNAVPKHDTPM